MNFDKNCNVYFNRRIKFEWTLSNAGSFLITEVK